MKKEHGDRLARALEFANESAARRCIFDSYGVNKYE